MTINTARYDDSYDELLIDEDFDDEFEEDEFDCGFVPGYGCQLAGTEDCDFECPQRDALLKHPDYPNCSIYGTDLIAEEALQTDTAIEEQAAGSSLAPMVVLLMAAYEPENWLVMEPVQRYEILTETERVLFTHSELLGEAGVAALKAKRQQSIALLREQVCQEADPLTQTLSQS